MYEQVERPKENKSRAVANSVAQRKSNEKQGFGFIDNRLNLFSHQFPIIQREVENSKYVGEYAKGVEEYVGKLNAAVKKVWGMIILAPTLGEYAQLDGHTKLWVQKITTYGQTKKDPGGLHTAFGYAVESLVVCKAFLPSPPAGVTIAQQGTRGSTRPDLILLNNGNDVAWLDLTASSSAGHIFSKSGGWKQAVSYAEISYPSIGQTDLINMATSAVNSPNASFGSEISYADYVKQQEQANKDLKDKLDAWKAVLTDALKEVKQIRLHTTDTSPRINGSVNVLTGIFGHSIDPKLANNIIAAVELNPKTYGFITGYSCNKSTGVAYLIDKSIPN